MFTVYGKKVRRADMKIKEAEERLGIPRAAIRFYEKQGLIQPKRNPDNEYREYSEEDLKRLKKILVLRKLGFSLSEIEDLLEDNMDFHDALERQIALLEEKKQETEAAIDVCRNIRKNCSSIRMIDEDSLWDEIQKKEKEGYTFADILCTDAQTALYDAASKVEYSPVHGPRTPDLIYNPMQKTTGKIQSFWSQHSVLQLILVILVIAASLAFVIFISNL